jgi:hypothetical protein
MSQSWRSPHLSVVRLRVWPLQAVLSLSSQLELPSTLVTKSQVRNEPVSLGRWRPNLHNDWSGCFNSGIIHRTKASNNSSSNGFASNRNFTRPLSFDYL